MSEAIINERIGGVGEIFPTRVAPIYEAFAVGPRIRESAAKRMLDIAGALFGLVFLAPFFLIVAAAIYLEDRGPVIFRQRRTGYGGQLFYVCKFRTMRVQEDGPTIVQAKKNDARTTRCGHFLRRSGIDELPQLINVLKGEMSLVGPRPHALAHDDLFSATVDGYRDRFLTRPGITGLAQVSGFRGEIHSQKDIVGRTERDLQYVREWSIALDIQILLQTLTMGPYHPAAY